MAFIQNCKLTVSNAISSPVSAPTIHHKHIHLPFPNYQLEHSFSLILNSISKGLRDLTTDCLVTTKKAIEGKV
jgi:hypothetical protein